jgi:hypothetical protein
MRPDGSYLGPRRREFFNPKIGPKKNGGQVISGDLQGIDDIDDHLINGLNVFSSLYREMRMQRFIFATTGLANDRSEKSLRSVGQGVVKAVNQRFAMDWYPVPLG